MDFKNRLSFRRKSMYGMMAIVFLIASVAVGYFVFQAMKTLWQIPFLVNLPGAFFVGAAVITFTSWMSHDQFEARLSMPPPPQIPWYLWLGYLVIAAIWYTGAIVWLTTWRRAAQIRQGTK